MSRGSEAHLRMVRAAVEEFGGRITSITTGGKHWRIAVHLANDHKLVMRISRSRIDPHKVRGWVRQKITNFTVDGKGSGPTGPVR